MEYNMAPLTIADALVKSLIINGCNTVFGVPGIQLYDLMDAFYRESDQIKFISTRHEQGLSLIHISEPTRPY